MLRDRDYLPLLSGALDAFGEARRTAWELGGDETAAKAPIEEDQLFWLIDVGLPKLEENWRPHLQKTGGALRLSGVFTHKTPLARFPFPKDPAVKTVSRELGDLLLVHERKGFDPGRSALLMQSKRMNNGRLAADNPEQARLYADWPVFELSGYGGDGTAFLPGGRDFTASRDGIRYLLMDDDPYSQSSGLWVPWWRWPGDHWGGWLVSDPRGAIGVPGSEDLAAALVNMLYQPHPPRGQAVATFAGASPPLLGKGQDFDVTVHELLTKTFTKELLTTKRGRHRRLRGEETAFMGEPIGRGPSSTSLAFTSAGTPPDAPPDDEVLERAGGERRPMAIVLIETEDD